MRTSNSPLYFVSTVKLDEKSFEDTAEKLKSCAHYLKVAANRLKPLNHHAYTIISDSLDKMSSKIENVMNNDLNENVKLIREMKNVADKAIVADMFVI